jgi:hypothetical protein
MDKGNDAVMMPKSRKKEDLKLGLNEWTEASGK